MTENKKERLREIEDRKIEILMEIPSVKDNTKKLLHLNSEYVHLSEEHYHLKIELIMAKQEP